MNTKQNSEFQSLNETTCFDYLDLSQAPELLHGYKDADAHSINDLQIILTRAKSFEELKGELTSFIATRKDFIQFLTTVWDEHSGTFVKPQPQ